MKQKFLCILLLACICQNAFAQTTTIPDANFEAFLEANGMGNGIPNDQLVTTANIENVTVLSFNVQNRAASENTSNTSNISDLTGIEDFTALEELNCNALQLVHLDVTSNLNLKTLYANDNVLQTIDVTGLTSLEILECDRNALESLSLNTNPAISRVLASYNSFRAIHIKNGNNVGIDTFRVQNNQYPICINVDNTAEGFLAEWDLDPLSGFGTNCGETNIPDADFEFALESNGMGNGIPNDNYVITANIENVTTLDLIGDILDLTGIEDFTALINLNCAGTDITTVNLSALTQLETLNCENTNLVSLDLTANINLTTLDASGTNLSALDLSQNSALTVLEVDSNPNLTALNIKNGNNTNITNIFIGTSESNLSCILVDDPAYSRANWSSVNTILFSDVDCATTEVHSEGLRDRLYLVPELDGAIAGVNILNHKAATVTTLSLSGNSVNDLTGIEAFTGLQELSCINSSITSLDLSQNTVLTKLYCNDNALTSLNVSQNLVLTELHCFNNNIASLDVSQNVVLTELYCNDNVLTDLDVSSNTQLIELDCSSNQLMRLNLKNGNNGALTTSKLDVNPNLTCIKVDDPTALYLTTIWVKDAQTSYDLTCGETYVPDDNFENYLETHNAAGNEVPAGDPTSMGNGIDNDNYVNTDDIEQVTSLQIGNQNIASLVGIEDFLAVNNLNFSNNQVVTVDLTNNVDLRLLSFNNNQITSIDLSANTALLAVIANDNQLTHLDFSANTALVAIEVQDNQLTSLNIKNGNNINFNYFDATNNPNLTCINVDDENASYLTTQNWLKDTTASYSEHCYETYVPDANFEAYLESRNYGNGIDNDKYVTTANIVGVTSLNIFLGPFPSNDELIADMTGIEDFTALKTLIVRKGLFESIDVSQNLLLETLVFFDGALTSLDVTQNTALTTLTCSNNNLTTLDITQNIHLVELNCNSNNLTMLDVTQNPDLFYINCSRNQLTNLDITQNPLLEGLECFDNQLTSLDVSQHPVFNYLFAHDNQLTSLNVANGNNTSMTQFEVYGNPNLTCIKVDDAAAANAGMGNYNNWDKDAQASYNDVSCDIILVAPKVYLQGAALNSITGEETLMRDDLRTASLLPTTSPYSDNATCDTAIFNTVGTDAIVDWIWVELRDATNNTLVIDAQSALLQRDGDVVAVDGISALGFNQIVNDYHIVIKHRNHLGVMTFNTVTLTTAITSVDFTNENDQITYGINAQTTFGMPANFVGMWTGNANGDAVVQYSGTTPDTPAILATVLNDVGNFLNFPTYAVSSYNENDVNMDGNIQYSGTNPDTPFILQNILSHPGNFLNFSTYQIIEQLPENN